MTVSPIQIQVLGELQVRAAGEPRELPSSRKTRALLGYLALTGREHRREQLCELFWDITDDPRAALRWSLSKLRKALGASGAACLVATRSHVHARLDPGALDAERLRSAARRGFSTCELGELEALAGLYRGELLEGLFLPDFDAFEAWLEAERSEARALHAKLRRELVARLAGEPERALAHARAWLSSSASEDAQSCVEQLSAELERRASRPAVSLSSAARAATAPRAATTTDGEAAPAAATSLLVGREAELQRLCRIADETRMQRRGRLVLALGEPGMGKTRLLEELCRRLEPLAPSLLSTTCHDAERQHPLAPFLDAARALLGELPSADGAVDREQLVGALAAAIRHGADERGLGLLLIDDAHLADPSSSELLHYVVRTAARSPLLTVLWCRPAELDDNAELRRVLLGLRRRYPVEELRLEPLGAEAIAALVGGEVTAERLAQLVSDSGGNPLIALEMARAEGNVLVPRNLADLVLARLEALPPDVASLVRWAAVFERGPVALLERAVAAQLPGFVDALETAVRYSLLRLERDGVVSVVHALIQRVVTESLSPLRRASMHGRIVEVLREAGGHDQGQLIAFHAICADRPDVAAEALTHAANRCMRVGAAREAAELADRALALVPRLAPAAALGVELEALFVLTRVRRPEQPELFIARLTALGLAALDQGRAEDAHRAFLAAAGLRWDVGDDAYNLARQAWRASRAGDTSHTDRTRASAFMALCLALMEKQLPDARAIVLEMETLAKADPRFTEPTEMVLARGQLHLHAGRIAEARQDAHDARTLARAAHNGLQEGLALQLSMQLELVAGQRAAARVAAEALTELATRIREGGEGAMADAGRALADGTLDTARAVLEAAVTRLQHVDDKRRQSWVLNRWARLEREHAHVVAARELSARALAAARAVEAPSEAALATCELMHAATRLGDDAAYADAEAVLAELEAQGPLSREARDMIAQTTGETPA